MQQADFESGPTRARDLYPFFLLLAIQMIANPDPLTEITRDCLEKSPITGDWQIKWFKRRGATAQVWMVTDLSTSVNPVALVQFLLRWTEPLLKEASIPKRNYLFLYKSKRSSREKIQRLRRQCRHFDGDYTSLMTAFTRKNNLPPFRVERLRESSVVADYIKHRQPRRAKDLLGHQSWDSLLHYLRSVDVVLLDGKSLSEGLQSGLETLAKTASAGTVIEQPVTAVDPRLRVGGEWDAGLNSCRDPYNSPIDGEVPGRPCRQLNACLKCANAMYTVEHLPLLMLRRRNLERRKVLSKATWSGSDDDDLWQIEARIATFSRESIERADREIGGIFDPVPLLREETVIG